MEFKDYGVVLHIILTFGLICLICGLGYTVVKQKADISKLQNDVGYQDKELEELQIKFKQSADSVLYYVNRDAYYDSRMKREEEVFVCPCTCPRGFPGDNGTDGDPGPPGPPGLGGPPGPPGIVGQIGIPGVAGVIGRKGVPGTSGVPGSIGPIGLVGPKGEQGQKGDIGPTGIKGDVGSLGPQGWQW